MNPLFNRRFNVAWMLSSIIMYFSSIVWHAIILNDFNGIKFGNCLFYCELALAYLVIGFVLTYFNFVFRRMLNNSKYAPQIGATVGLFIYLITLMIGINFNNHINAQIFIFDATWQIVEQTLGGTTFLLTMRIFRKNGYYLSSN